MLQWIWVPQPPPLKHLRKINSGEAFRKVWRTKGVYKWNCWQTLSLGAQVPLLLEDTSFETHSKNGSNNESPEWMHLFFTVSWGHIYSLSTCSQDRFISLSLNPNLLLGTQPLQGHNKRYSKTLTHMTEGGVGTFSTYDTLIRVTGMPRMAACS